VTAALAAALRAAAAGDLPGEAGTGLLIGSGAFLHRADFTSRFTGTAAGPGGGALTAWIDWEAAAGALDHGQLPASSGERAVLRIAASLAAGTPVSLCDTVTSLDQRNLALVTTAIRHASGHR
jgi:hypothetical protein